MPQDPALIRKELDALFNSLLGELEKRLADEPFIKPLALGLKWNGEGSLQWPDEDTPERMLAWLRESLGVQMKLNALRAAALVYDTFLPNSHKNALAFELEHESGEAIWMFLPYQTDGTSGLLLEAPMRYAQEGTPFTGVAPKPPKPKFGFKGRFSDFRSN